MFCTNCGSELREGAHFCTKCGAAAKNIDMSDAPAASRTNFAATGNAAGTTVSSDAAKAEGATSTANLANAARADDATSAAAPAVASSATSTTDEEKPAAASYGAALSVSSDQDDTNAKSETRVGTFKRAVETGRKRGRGKMSPIMIVVLVIALMSGTALAAHYVYQNVYLPMVQEQQKAALELSDSVNDESAEEPNPARDEALAAGMHVLKGQVKISTVNEWAKGRAYSDAALESIEVEGIGDERMAYLDFDEPEMVQSIAWSNWVKTQQSESVILAYCIEGDINYWEQFAGTEVEIALYPADIARPSSYAFNGYFNVIQSCRLIAPIKDEWKSSQSADASQRTLLGDGTSLNVNQVTGLEDANWLTGTQKELLIDALNACLITKTNLDSKHLEIYGHRTGDTNTAHGYLSPEEGHFYVENSSDNEVYECVYGVDVNGKDEAVFIHQI